MNRLLLVFASILFKVGVAFAQAPAPIPPNADTNRIQSYSITSSTAQIAVGFPVYGDCTDLLVTIAGVNQGLASALWNCASASGVALSLKPLPITDMVVNFTPPLTTGTLSITGAWHPRNLTVPTAPGINRREYQQTVGALIAAQRELYYSVVTGTSLSILTLPNVWTGTQTFSGLIKAGSTSAVDYVALYGYGGGSNNSILNMVDGGIPATVSACRTKNAGAPPEACIGLMAWGFNDKTSLAVPVWAIYPEARRYIGSGITTTIEPEITEFNTNAIALDPYLNVFASGNLSDALHIASGGGCRTATKCYNPVNGLFDQVASNASGAINLVNNGGAFLNGINVAYNAVNGNDGKTLGSIVPFMTLPMGDAIQWNYCNNTAATYPNNCGAGVKGARIYSQVNVAGSETSLTFTNTGPAFIEPAAGVYLFSIFTPSGAFASVANTVTIVTATTTNTPAVASSGSDTNVSLALTPKGTGTVNVTAGGLNLPSSTVAALPTCNAGLKGTLRYVTDAAATPVYNATAAAGSTVVIPVFCNGANWTNH